MYNDQYTRWYHISFRVTFVSIRFMALSTPNLRRRSRAGNGTRFKVLASHGTCEIMDTVLFSNLSLCEVEEGSIKHTAWIYPELVRYPNGLLRRARVRTLLQSCTRHAKFTKSYESGHKDTYAMSPIKSNLVNEQCACQSWSKGSGRWVAYAKYVIHADKSMLSPAFPFSASLLASWLALAEMISSYSLRESRLIPLFQMRRRLACASP